VIWLRADDGIPRPARVTPRTTNEENDMTRPTRLAALAAFVTAIGATAVAAGPGAGPGFGDGRGRGPALDFAGIDTDGDGAVSRDELTARATARLSAADADGDGMLDRAEIAAALPMGEPGIVDVFGPDRAERAASRILAMVGATEAGEAAVDAMAAQRVDMALSFLDANGDSAISEEEASEMAARFGGHHRGGPGGRDRGDNRLAPRP
jgi:hypothetical protein